ncbi:MAG: hypothetical protein GDA43_17155 [Hormoscilla sp. SP5CHS1]|nr:hypothetical protein [Hormoscilla sp. SP12CHS1]MBC6454713.1 hypothetical protein [Hormoscilla sp. SP5CHS1]MBC6471658.1 hypothetical protein [Hormoscilla sp. GM102CHS1]
MCEAVSARFQLYQEKGMLDNITTGRVDGYPVICVSEHLGDRCVAEVLFPLKPSDDPVEVLQTILNVRDFGSPPLIW